MFVLGAPELLLLFFMLPLYFTPSIVAFVRGHRQRVAILLLNLFAGGTFMVWVAALVWSVMSKQTEKEAATSERHFCSHCGAAASINAHFCPQCGTKVG